MILRQLFHAPSNSYTYLSAGRRGGEALLIGATSSTIGEERRHNPRLQVRSRAEYVAQMAQLKLPKPALMEEVLPANLGVSLLSIDCRH